MTSPSKGGTAEPVVIRIVDPRDVAAGTDGGAWMIVALMAALLAGMAWVLLRPARRPARRARAEREEHSGYALLQLAREIDEHAMSLERAGTPSYRHRHWARQCRRLAAGNLERINELILDELRQPVRRRRIPWAWRAAERHGERSG